MKHTHTPLALAGLCLFVSACGEVTTDAELPVGVAPVSAAELNRPTPPETGQTPHQSTPSADPNAAPEPLLAKPANNADQPAPDAEPKRQTIAGMSYVLPEGWSVGPEKQMRLLTLVPPDDFADAELAVSRWPGDVGGFSANVTRWARQLGIQAPQGNRI